MTHVSVDALDLLDVVACQVELLGEGPLDDGDGHPNLVTLYVWLWFDNPSGLFASINPLVRPFNRG